MQCAFRYLGVVESEQIYNHAIQPSSNHKVAFEWRLEDGDNVQHKVVEPQLPNVLRRGVPLPPCVRQNTVDVDATKLKQFTQRAVSRVRSILFEKLSRDDFEVTCQYLGVSTRNGVDINAPANRQSNLVFKWSLQTSEWQWNEEVSLYVKDVDRRELPLPKCTMTHQRLTDLANKAGQGASNNYMLDVSCTYFFRIQLLK